VQEYLKCLNDMGYHERTYKGRQTSKYSEKPTLQGRFFHIWKSILLVQSLYNQEKQQKDH